MIINQDIKILGEQMATINRYGAHFHNTEADVIHVLIESIRDELSRGGAGATAAGEDVRD